MSLPKSLSDIEQLLSDSIPCKIRAKRGCATHPRSIAERVISFPYYLCAMTLVSLIVRLSICFVEQVRRTKISERMRKLQDLVPNMDTVKIDLPLLIYHFLVLFSICIYNL